MSDAPTARSLSEVDLCPGGNRFDLIRSTMKSQSLELFNCMLNSLAVIVQS